MARGILERLAQGGLIRGKTIGVDSTTLEANAALKSIVRRDTGESYSGYLKRLAAAEGLEAADAAALRRMDRKRKKKTSNAEWASPSDAEAEITKLKDGRTALAYKAENAVDRESGAIVAVTTHGGAAADTDGLQEVVADKGYHSNDVARRFAELEVRTYIAEPERGARSWNGKQAEKESGYANRRRIRGEHGKRLQRQRGEKIERNFAHQFDTGGLDRLWVRGIENVHKKLLIQAAACNLALLMRSLYGAGKPKAAHDRMSKAVLAILAFISAIEESWRPLSANSAKEPRESRCSPNRHLLCRVTRKLVV